MAGLLVKYRSLLPEFLWQWHGSLQHFVLLTSGAVVVLTSPSTSSSALLTTQQFRHRIYRETFLLPG